QGMANPSSLSQFAPPGHSSRMRDARPGWGWLMAGAVAFITACSSSGVVLESRRGEPVPRNEDGGAAAADEDAGPPKGVDPDSLRSGSRIHVRVEISDGELLAVQGPHDTLHDVDCYVGLADDGVSRCLPSVSPPNGDL